MRLQQAEVQGDRLEAPDVMVENHGTIFLVRPLTEAAFEWIENNISGESQWFGNALAIEHRYVAALTQGMINDGLEVQ